MKRYLMYLLATIVVFVQMSYGQEFKGAAADSVSLAETYLNKIAAKKERQRKTGGAIALGLGVLSTAAGIAAISDDDFLADDLGTAFIIQGAGFISGNGAFIAAQIAL